MKAFPGIIVFLAGALVGALGFYLLGPTAEADGSEAEFAAARVAAPAEPASSPEEEPAPPPAAPSRDVECETMLAFAKASLEDANKKANRNEELVGFLEELVEKSGAGTPGGEPMEFPDGLAASFQPEQFRAAVDRLKQECPRVFPRGTNSDCSEFPCVINLHTKKPASKWSAADCPAYKELFGSSTSTSGSNTVAPDGEKQSSLQVVPIPEGDGIKEHMREYEGNFHKRRKARFREFRREYRRSVHKGPCLDMQEAESCNQLANSYRDDDPDKYLKYSQQACEYGSGSGCNNYAWERCHERGDCDQSTLDAARRATEIDPENGKGAWDTYARVACAMGKTSEANRAFQRSCELGYQKNCDESC